MADVTLPALGESVTEGIITQWLVAVGDTVEVDQPLVEVSTDKVDTEIPSPVAGVVQELNGAVDDTIEVGHLIAVIGGEGAAPAAAPAAPAEPVAAAPAPEPAAAAPATPAPAAAAPTLSGAGLLTSPLVRKLLREANIDPRQVTGTGPGGKITRADAEAAVASPPATAAATGAAGSGFTAVAPPQAFTGGVATPNRPGPGNKQIEFGGQRSVTEPITRVRKAIASGMRASLENTAQLTAVVEADLTAVMNLRAGVKDEFKSKHGASLSPLPFIMRATAMTLSRHPIMNSTLDLESGTATFNSYVNLGMAVDTERGLLVANIKDAQDLTIVGIAKAIADLAKRTRGKGLKPDDIMGGTFTVTNTGSLGTLLDTPIVNHPEVAILGAAAIEKRPVVVSDNYGDSIAIRWMTYFCLSYDHQAIDGADSARFLQDLKWTLEHHDFRGELGL